VLGKMGRAEAAAIHWRRYLELDLGSPWSQIARSHLEQTEDSTAPDESDSDEGEPVERGPAKPERDR
jgi:hypothetical protein